MLKNPMETYVPPERLTRKELKRRKRQPEEAAPVSALRRELVQKALRFKAIQED